MAYWLHALRQTMQGGADALVVDPGPLTLSIKEDLVPPSTHPLLVWYDIFHEHHEPGRAGCMPQVRS
jgi:hypothetical protein